MSDQGACSWFLGYGISYIGLGLASLLAPETCLKLWGAKPEKDIVAVWRLIGIPLTALGSWNVYASLGDDDEQKHAARVGLLSSLLFAFWCGTGLSTLFPQWATQAAVAANAVYALGNGYYAKKLSE